MATTIPELKVILCGEYGVGKTSIFRRFTLNTYIDDTQLSKSQARQLTLGLDHCSKIFDLDTKSPMQSVSNSISSTTSSTSANITTSTSSSSTRATTSTIATSNNERRKRIKLQLWDTGGLERVASITNSYYKYADGALLVFSLNSLESFHCLPQHLLEILSMAENAKIFLVGNKLDIKPLEVTDNDIDLFLEQFPKFSGLFKISCKQNLGINEMFSEIIEKLSQTFNYKASNLDTFKLHQLHNEYDCCKEKDYDDGSCCAK